MRVAPRADLTLNRDCAPMPTELKAWLRYHVWFWSRSDRRCHYSWRQVMDKTFPVLQRRR